MRAPQRSASRRCVRAAPPAPSFAIIATDTATPSSYRAFPFAIHSNSGACGEWFANSCI
jgi:hypothetical protein